MSPQVILLKLGSFELKSSLDSECGITVIVKCNIYLGKISGAILKPFEAFMLAYFFNWNGIFPYLGQTRPHILIN